MCGIVGTIALREEGLNRDATNTLRDLTFIDTVRGADSTGVFFHKEDAKEKHSLWVYKDAVPGYEFLGGRNDWWDMLGKSAFAIVHNRAATIGKVTKELAHPFTEGTVTGVHNGTVRAWEHLCRDIPVDGMMDSHAIIALLAHTDPDPEAVTAVLQKLEFGAYSLVWYDKRTETLRFARNHDRPMTMVRTYANLWIGSEMEMVEWALARNKTAMHESWEVKPHVLVDIPIKEGMVTAHPYAPRKYTSYPSSTGSYGSYVYTGVDDDDDDELPFRGGASWWDKQYGAPASKRSAWDEWREAQARQDKGVARDTISGNLRSGLTSLVITQRSTLPVSVPTECCQRIYTEMRQMVGLASWHGTVPTLRAIINTYLADQCVETVYDVKADATLVPAHVVDVDDNGMYGYIEVGGRAVAAAFSLVTAELRRDVEQVLATGMEAIVYNCEVDALKVYHHGDVAFRVGRVHPDAHTVWTGTLPIDQEDDKSMFNEFAFGHPDRVCKLAGVDWNAGWTTTKEENK